MWVDPDDPDRDLPWSVDPRAWAFTSPRRERRLWSPPCASCSRLVLVLLLRAAPASADVEYTVTDLSLLGQPTLDAWAVNDDGVVVGTMNTGAPYSGFRWTERLGLRALEGKDAIPRDINNAGVAAGLYSRPEDFQFFTGARWDVFGTLSPLMPEADPLCPEDSDDDDCDGAYARGISPDGVAVGAPRRSTAARAATTAPRTGSPPPPTRSACRPRSEHSRRATRRAGWSGPTRSARRSGARPGDKVVLPLLDQGEVAQARDINDAGVVVGDGATRPGNARNRAFTWTEAEGVRRLDTLGFGTEAHAISARGEIVGMSRVTDDDPGRRAVRWVDRKIADLNTLIPPDSGWTLIEAHDVNANGWIVGRGLKDGVQRAFLLRPAPTLDIKLEGAGWDPFQDTFLVRATVTNIGTAPVTGLTLTPGPHADGRALSAGQARDRRPPARARTGAARHARARPDRDGAVDGAGRRARLSPLHRAHHRDRAAASRRPTPDGRGPGGRAGPAHAR